jgi:hypothetical protein
MSIIRHSSRRNYRDCCYDICIDDHSYPPTALVERCDRLKHIVFLGTGAGSYMNVGERAQRGIRVHTIKGYDDAAVAGHAIALTIEERDKIALLDSLACRRPQVAFSICTQSRRGG